MAPPALAAIDQHHPWKMLDNMALIIIDQTYATALEIVRGDNMGVPPKDGIANLSRPINPADPDSPVLTVHASARVCCIAFNNSRGDAAGFRNYTSPKGKAGPNHRLTRTTVSVSSGMIHLSRFDGRKDYWKCADVQPDVASRGELAILDMVVMRLDAAIRVQQTLLYKANAVKCCCPKYDEAVEVFQVLREMRREMDLDAFMARRLQKRRCVDETVASLATDQEQADETEALTKRLKKLRVDSGERVQTDVLICKTESGRSTADKGHQKERRLYFGRRNKS